jgi:hypothetical protein
MLYVISRILWLIVLCGAGVGMITDARDYHLTDGLLKLYLGCVVGAVVTSLML